MCLDYLTWTYYFRRVVKNPTYYGVIDNTPKGTLSSTVSPLEINAFLIDLVDKTLLTLEADGCCKVVDNYFIETTFLGHISSFYYIKHETANFFHKTLNPKMTIIEALKCLAFAKEFDEIPLRHNEDNYNESLYKICPYKTEDKAFDSSNYKTFLLFQMYFSRLPAPIRDYVIDAKLAIDSSIRIIHAMIDICADRGYFSTVQNLIYVLQMLVQGIWVTESQFINIPHFTNEMIKVLHHQEKVSYLCQLMELSKEGAMRPLLKKVNASLTEDMLNEIEDRVNYIPDITFKAFVTGFDSDKMEKDESKHLILCLIF
jgi:activating signal cointegrator complex subunit 3